LTGNSPSNKKRFYDKTKGRNNQGEPKHGTDGQRPRTGAAENKRQLESGGQDGDAEAKTGRRLAALKPENR
jgi:hypothetical protein